VFLTALFLVANEAVAMGCCSLFVTHVRYVAALAAYAGVGHLQQ